MQDYEIVDLYWERNEGAIDETEKKYGKYLSKIAYNVLYDYDDSKETVNETYLRAWNSMPTNRPTKLSTYLGKITRQLAIDVYRTQNRQKRKATEYAVSLDELADCLSDENLVEQSTELKELSLAINKYLKGLKVQNRVIFVCRYYYMDSIKDIASYYDMSESKVKSILYRTRLGLKSYLEEEGIWL
ncbi:MAG: RNA polymerase sigma factor [Firmicutes bacterium]|nr:RNA polymerase sigma factor [Bacillota bacterium]